MISIIVPAYNVESAIGNTLNSILVQTYPDIEIIVIDDGSTDNTGSVIDTYASKYKQIIVLHTQNHGVTVARLMGVKHASGEWIGFVDGDDEIEPGMYELLFENAVKYKADISHCGYQMIFKDGRINYFHNTGCLVQQDRIDGLRELLDGSLIEPSLCNKLFHRRLFCSLLNTDVMDRNIKINEDLLMNYILFSESNKSVFQDTCLYHYFERSTSVTRKSLNPNKIFDPIRVKWIILNMNIENMNEATRKAFIGTCINVYNSLVLDKTEKFLQEKRKVWKLIHKYNEWFPLLSRKQQFLANFILHWPKAYIPIYRFYAKHFLKNKYT